VKNLKVFLSYQFRDEDRDLVAKIEALLASQDVPIVRGKRLGGGALTPEVMQRIESADALVALMTRRDRVGDEAEGRWRTSRWVESELDHARGKGKLAIALIEAGVELGGAYGEHESIPLDRGDPLEAILALSETIRVWKDQVGFTRAVQIKPDELGLTLRTAGDLSLRYRMVTPQGRRSGWRTAEPITQPNGTILYVDGVEGEDHFIEIEVVEGEEPKWWSPATAQLISVELLPRQGGARDGD
jgi:hypothetical protein